MKAPVYILSAFLLFGCAAEPEKKAPADPTAAAIAAAKAAHQDAVKKGFAWRDTGKMLKKAKAAQKKGDSEKAMKLAKKVQQQSELAVKQGMDQAKAGPRF